MTTARPSCDLPIVHVGKNVCHIANEILTKIGIGLTKDYVLVKEQPTMKNQAFDHTSSTTTTSASSPNRYNPKGYTTSIRGLLPLMGMAILANIVLALAGQSIRLYTVL
jgi:hypothetical protein